jgi:hypothetical protein
MLIITLALLALVVLAVPAGAAKPTRDVSVTLTATLPWPTDPADGERDLGAFVNVEGDVVRFKVETTLKEADLVIDVDGVAVYDGGLVSTYDWTVLAIPEDTTNFVATATVSSNGAVPSDTTEVTVYHTEPCTIVGGAVKVPTNTRPNAACVWTPTEYGGYTLTIDGVPASMKRFPVTIRDHAPGDYCYAHEFPRFRSENGEPLDSGWGGRLCWQHLRHRRLHLARRQSDQLHRPGTQRLDADPGGTVELTPARAGGVPAGGGGSGWRGRPAVGARPLGHEHPDPLTACRAAAAAPVGVCARRAAVDLRSSRAGQDEHQRHRRYPSSHPHERPHHPVDHGRPGAE